MNIVEEVTALYPVLRRDHPIEGVFKKAIEDGTSVARLEHLLDDALPGTRVEGDGGARLRAEIAKIKNRHAAVPAAPSIEDIIAEKFRDVLMCAMGIRECEELLEYGLFGTCVADEAEAARSGKKRVRTRMARLKTLLGRVQGGMA